MDEDIAAKDLKMAFGGMAILIVALVIVSILA